MAPGQGCFSKAGSMVKEILARLERRAHKFGTWVRWLTACESVPSSLREMVLPTFS